MRLRNRAMRRFFFCAKFISLRGPGVGQFHALAALQRHGDFGDLRGKVFGDLRGGALRFEKFGVVKQRAENAEIFRAVNLVVGEFVSLLNRAVEIGADDVAVKIADNEQRRIEQRFAVAEQLLVSLVEIFLFAFVFPAEAAFFPNVGKAALAPARRRRAFRASRKAPRL